MDKYDRLLNVRRNKINPNPISISRRAKWSYRSKAQKETVRCLPPCGDTHNWIPQQLGSSATHLTFGVQSKNYGVVRFTGLINKHPPPPPHQVVNCILRHLTDGQNLEEKGGGLVIRQILG